jgi:tetratricopeptide (TPR) repeat protein
VNQSPEDTPLNELSGPVRRAVDQVRSEPVPAESMTRTIGRVRRQAKAPRRQMWLRYGVLAVAAAAVLMFVANLALPGLGGARALVSNTKAPQGAKAVFSNGPEEVQSLDKKALQHEEDAELLKLDKALARLKESRPLNEGPTAPSSPKPGLPPGPFPPGESKPSVDGRFVEEMRREAAKDEKERAGEPHPTHFYEIRGASRGKDMPAGQNGGAGKAPNKGNAGGTGRDDEKGEQDPKKPQVWHREGKAPTVARVFIGDGNSLELVSLQVTTTIEGPRARTVIDHVFRNPHHQQLEGTFEYPLPTGASPSYFGMFLGQSRGEIPPRFAGRDNEAPLPAALAALPPEQLVKNVNQSDWGRLQEARVVGKQKALEVYEEVVRGRIDPALLEHAGGNTFRGRVFPIPAAGYNRVIFAYEELLPITQGKALYKFPLPEGKLQALQFTLRGRLNDGTLATFQPEAARVEREGEVMFTKTWYDKAPGGEAVFTYAPNDLRIQAVCSRQSETSSNYVYARIRPELAATTGKTFAKHAVFLLDTSLSEHPDRFNINMKLIRNILEKDSDIEQFNIMTFNVGTAWVEPKGWLANTKDGRETAFTRLDGLVLEGATDLGAALQRLAKPGFDVPKALPINVFVMSDGQITWGEPDVATLSARFDAACSFRTQFNCYRTGLGADNLELFESLTRKGGGIFNCYNEADLAAAALAHKHQCLQVDRVRFVGGPAVTDVMVAGRKAAVYPNGELVVVGKASTVGRATLMVEGMFQGEKFAEEYPIDLKPTGELAARGWAEVAVASLLSLKDANLDPLVTAYCQQFGIGSKVASFLVLENQADYTRFNLDKEQGKAIPTGDLGKFLDEAWQGFGKVISARDDFKRFLALIEPRVHLMAGAEGEHVKKMLELLKDGDCEMPESVILGTLLHNADVPAEYLKAREADRRNPEPYLTEAQRRSLDGDPAGAVRVLSSLIEENPERGDALRLVGYRLLDLNQPAHAARLFSRVQRQRPFEPHSYLDLARSLEQSGKYGLAAIQYEIVMAGTWHQRFHASLKDVAREDYGRMMRQAIRSKAVEGELADHFGDRLEKMDPKKLQADLRVSMSWNTDGTDVDLWVIEPSGEKCYYQHKQTQLGGQLSDDMTQGYGPERYQIKKAAQGEYTIIAHYFRPNANLLAGETHVNVVITRNAGTPEETIERKTVILKKHNDQVEVAKVKF